MIQLYFSWSLCDNISKVQFNFFWLYQHHFFHLEQRIQIRLFVLFRLGLLHQLRTCLQLIANNGISLVRIKGQVLSVVFLMFIPTFILSLMIFISPRLTHAQCFSILFAGIYFFRTVIFSLSSFFIFWITIPVRHHLSSYYKALKTNYSAKDMNKKSHFFT